MIRRDFSFEIRRLLNFYGLLVIIVLEENVRILLTLFNDVGYRNDNVELSDPMQDGRMVF